MSNIAGVRMSPKMADYYQAICKCNATLLGPHSLIAINRFLRGTYYVRNGAGAHRTLDALVRHGVIVEEAPGRWSTPL